MMTIHRIARLAGCILLAVAAICVTSGCADDHAPNDGWRLDGDVGVDDDIAVDVAPGDAASTPVLTPSEFNGRFWGRRMCALLARCEHFRGAVGEYFELACHPRAHEILRSSDFAAALAGPRVEFRAVAARACLERLAQTSTCEEVYSGLDDCFDVTVGIQEEGDACIHSIECRSEMYCDVGDTCPGRCVQSLSEAEPCERGQCGPNLYCDTLESDRCKPTGLEEGAECSSRAECGKGLTCCGSRELCTDEHFATCVPKLAEGEVCSSDMSSIARVPCQPHLFCVDGVCQTGEAPGKRCSGDTPCALGNHCVEGTCFELLLPGDGCEIDQNCPVSYFCDAGTCEPLPMVGESCESAGRCYEGACTDGVCEMLPNGAECDTREMLPRCESGFCRHDGETGQSTCAAVSERRYNECLNQFECAAGETCDGQECRAACTEIE